MNNLFNKTSVKTEKRRFAFSQSAVSNPKLKIARVLVCLIFLLSAAVSIVPAQIQAWGDNSYGELGNGLYGGSYTVPTVIAGTGDITAFGAGKSHTLAINADGTVLAWGRNDYGQLGNNATVPSYSPVAVSGLTDVVAVSGGFYHSVALKSDGSVWAWGDNVVGQLGNGTTGYSPSLTPVQVSNLSNIIAIDAGEYFSLALKSDGTVWAWGNNAQGQIGNGAIGSPANCGCVPTPVKVPGLTGIIAIAAGDAHAMALKKDGRVWLWGFNYHGQIGTGTSGGSYATPQRSSITGVTEIAAGHYYSLALKPNGTVYAWGFNTYGELGIGTTNTIGCNCVPTPQKTLISNVTDIKSLGYHSLAIKKDGSVWAWGENGSGQMGNGTSGAAVTTPVQSTAGTGLFTFGIGYFHSLAANPSVTTPAGTNVRLGGENLRIAFSALASGGITSYATIVPTTTGLTVPIGLTVLANSQAYQLTTSAAFDAAATAEVCIKVETQYSETIFNNLKLLHGEGIDLIDRTTSRNYQRRELCGVTDSLGVFVIAQ